MSVQSLEQMEEQGDQVKDLVLAQLIVDGLLTDEDARRWSKTHTIILKRRSKISMWYRELFGKEEASQYTILVATIREQEGVA